MRRTLTLAALPALCLLLSAGATLALEEKEEKKEKRVKIVKLDSVVECDGDDCPDDKHHSIFIREDGDVEILGDGLHEWTEGEHPKILHLGAHGMGGTFLGVGMSELTPELRAHFGVPEDAGVMVSKVVDDSPAARGGILVGDVIYRVDGEPVKNGHDLARRIRGREEDDIVDLEIWREGSPVTITTTLERREGGLFGGEAHRVIVRCDGDEGDEDCNVDVQTGPFADHDFDCGGADECKVRVECRDGSCDCSVNGEAVDCATIPGVPHSE